MPRRSRCPDCDADLEPGAAACIECGYRGKSGRQSKTRSEPVRRVFGSSPMRPWRYYPAMGLAVLGTILCILTVVLSQTDYRDRGGVAIPLVVGLVLLGMPFFLGYGHSVTVTRDKKGEPIAVKNTWICFRPIGANTLYLDDWDALYFDHFFDANDFPHFILKIGRDRRGKFFKLYDGQMRDIADAIEDLTGMPLKRL